VATKPSNPADFAGRDAELASVPMAQTPRGGMESAFRGESGSVGSATEQAPPFAGMGPLMESADDQVFQQVHGLVLRQELIALNHLAQDSHWTYVKLGYPWSTLTKEPTRDVYKQTLPYGSAGITVQAVPNKAWDLINKTTEALLVDFPEAEAEPTDDTEEAQAAKEMANRFLSQDAGEQGTSDALLFNDRVNRSLTSSSSYLECWTDPTGGGYVPLQIKAHPEAQDVAQPLLGPDGNPTTDPILRYVVLGPDGQPLHFVDDASQASPQWQPKIRDSKWQREHVRVFPESLPVEKADKVIILGFCTIGEAKKRWKSVAAMQPDELSALTDWTPPRYLVLLPPFQRARWKLTDGRDKEKAGSSDERIVFYYHIFAKASPDYPKGADVVVSGSKGGLVIDRQPLSKEVTVNGQKETRCMEIPVVQITPRQDPDEADPSGRAFIELFAGAAENNAFLAMSFSQIIDQILHTPFSIPSTSPIEGWQVEEARASGDFLIVTRPEDKPVQLQPPLLPTGFQAMYELADEAINSIASSERAATGADNSKERSGKALQIAVSQNNVSLSGMQNSVNQSYARWCRLKIERAMSDFSTAQQISYVGEDGAYKQDEWTGVDFALIGKVVIKAGTGTMMPPDQKVQYIGNLQAAGLIPPDEASDAARPSFAKRLGLPDNPQQQRIERQITGFLKGPPSPEWIQQAQVFQQAKAASDQQNAVAQQDYQNELAQHQANEQNSQTLKIGTSQPVPEQPQQAVPMDANGQPMQAPWTPFNPLPMDNEPLNAQLRMRRLGKMMAQVKFEAFPPEWQQVAIAEYQNMSNAVLAAQPAEPLPKGVSIVDKASGGDVAQEERKATHPNQPQRAA
jgi:hypothetical protein